MKEVRTAACKGVDFISCEEMKALEKQADECGLSYYQMMENAGRCAAEAIMDKVLPCSVLVFCGKGNNGGDGFVVARVLCNAGYRVMIVLVDGEPVSSDALANYRLVRQLPIHYIDMNGKGVQLTEFADGPMVIVDAVYGTGFHGQLQGNGLLAAEYMNRYKESGSELFAVDIPSGLSGDMTETRELDRNGVKADFTVAFHAKKPVHVQDFAAEYCGKIIVADIGIGDVIGKETGEETGDGAER